MDLSFEVHIMGSNRHGNVRQDHLWDAKRHCQILVKICKTQIYSKAEKATGTS